MNIQQLKGFVLVAQTRNITKAAREMHLTQQALSKSIAKLEEELDASLFYRTDRQTLLTETGQKIYPVAQSLIRKHEEHEGLMRDIVSQNKHSMKIAFENVVLLNAFPAELLSRIGNISVAAYLGLDNASCVNDVLTHRATCAFAILPPDLKGLCYYPVIEAYPNVIMSRKHPLAKKKAITIDELRYEKHAWLSVNSQSFQDYYNACIDAGFYPNITKEFPTAELLRQSIPNGMEITVGAGFLVNEQDNVEIRPLICDSCVFKAGFIFRPTDVNNQNMMSYFQVVKDSFDMLR